MNKRFVTKLTLFCLLALCFASTAATAQDLKLDPAKGYTQEQALALTSRFSLYEWKVTGTIVGLSEEQGKVDVSNPIETYIPRLAKSEWKGTPVIDILDMASGMSGLEADDPKAYTNPNSPYALFESSLGADQPTEKTMKSTYDYIASLKRQKPSGKKNEYTSVNTFVLGWLASFAARYVR